MERGEGEEEMMVKERGDGEMGWGGEGRWSLAGWREVWVH